MVTVSPSTLTLNAGQIGAFTVTFTRTTATLNTYTGGQLTWTGGGHTVRIPIIIRPVPIAATLIRLLGAFLPKTLEGTIDGSANSADALRELLKNSRRD